MALPPASRESTVLITGASKGIGFACAEVFAEEGSHLHLAARNGAAMEEAATRLRAQFGVRVTVHQADLSSTAAMEKLALCAPVVGHLLDDARLPSPATVPVAGWTRPVIEPEVAVTMGRDLGAAATRAEALLAIATLGPALELADLEFPPEDVERIVGANIYQRHVVLGPQRPVAESGFPDARAAQVWQDGQALSVPEPLHALTGDPVEVVMHVAAVLAAAGRALRAGEIVITGSVVPPVFGRAGTRVRFALAPVGEVEVALG